MNLKKNLLVNFANLESDNLTTQLIFARKKSILYSVSPYLFSCLFICPPARHGMSIKRFAEKIKIPYRRSGVYTNVFFFFFYIYYIHRGLEIQQY